MTNGSAGWTAFPDKFFFLEVFMPIKVERKLFATGNSLAITLPQEWIKNFALKAGDSIEIVLEEELIIRPKQNNNIDSIQT
jgi:antitoxin component of MazEF toxin-antitoxin module